MTEGKILVLGTPGLVGSRFIEIYRGLELLTPSVNELDITDINALYKYLNSYDITTIINFAAYTDVGGGELQRDDKKGSCWRVNVGGVRNLVRMISKSKIYLIHISSDMVFSGTKSDPGPYSENHKPENNSQRLTWYGFTKAWGEKIIQEGLVKRASILRLIYPVRAKYSDKSDYLRKTLNLFDEKKLYPMFDDQQVSITSIDEACNVILRLVKIKENGIFHASSADTASPYEIASYLIRKARGKEDVVRRMSLNDFLKTAVNKQRYPKFGGLKVNMTEKRLGIKFSTWREIIDILVKQGIGKQNLPEKVRP